jgi:hypothetical protein
VSIGALVGRDVPFLGGGVGGFERWRACAERLP